MKTIMRATRLFLILAPVLLASTAPLLAADFKLVVNAANTVSSLTPDETAQYFLKKKTTWSSGQAVQPVDLTDDAAPRLAFSKAVLKKDVGAVKSFWQTQIFAGRAVPPPEKGSDAAVLAYVEANPGAIGYVSPGAVLGRGVREVNVN
jgi:ABC-type phosphate transport system substrate-binding protein